MATKFGIHIMSSPAGMAADARTPRSHNNRNTPKPVAKVWNRSHEYSGSDRSLRNGLITQLIG